MEQCKKQRFFLRNKSNLPDLLYNLKLSNDFIAQLFYCYQLSAQKSCEFVLAFSTT